MERKIRVVWVCHFMNETIRKNLRFKVPIAEKIIRKLSGHKMPVFATEYSVWVSNGIEEFEKIPECELHIICPQGYLSKEETRFTQNGVYYYFFRDEASSLKDFFTKIIDRKHRCSYKNNYLKICEIVRRISPDIIHIIGAEAPSYSPFATMLEHKYPIIVQLQTLINDPDFQKNFYFTKHDYQIRSSCERQTIEAADYIGTTAQKFIDIIKKQLYPEATIVNTTLALIEPINLAPTEKKYDFVYFAADIAKAADWVIEAFAIASRKHPGITLDIIGGYSVSFRQELENRISKLGLSKFVFFEGRLPTHEDVLQQLRLSRFAVIPMKIDLVTGTIREAMANGVPVVTTITPASPELNAFRESVLLSEKGDFQAMADNMCKLIENPEYANLIRHNAAITTSEYESNYKRMCHWMEVYKVCIDNYKTGTLIPDSYISFPK